jgi:ferredoxin
MSAPDLFVLSDEDGHAQAIHEEVPAGQEDRAREAVRSCPEQAILVLSDEPAVGAVR